MSIGSERAAQAVFQSISDDGADWLFVILPDDRWAITRNGEKIAVGAGTGASIAAGVLKFRLLTAAMAESVLPSGKPKREAITRPYLTEGSPVYSHTQANASS
jgi:hypothetical protein